VEIGDVQLCDSCTSPPLPFLTWIGKKVWGGTEVKDGFSRGEFPDFPGQIPGGFERHNCHDIPGAWTWSKFSLQVSKRNNSLMELEVDIDTLVTWNVRIR
jgi:hypothetical protein